MVWSRGIVHSWLWRNPGWASTKQEEAKGEATPSVTELSPLWPHCGQVEAPWVVEAPYLFCCSTVCLLGLWYTAFLWLYPRKHSEQSGCHTNTFDEDMDNWADIMDQVLQFLCVKFNVNTFQHLVDMINDSNMLPQSSSPLNPIDLSLIKNYCQARKIDIKFDAITCVAVLLHWRVFLVLLQQLAPQYLFEVSNFSPASFRATVKDSHLHLDQIRKELSRPSLSLHECVHLIDPQLMYSVSCVISNCVYPTSWPVNIVKEEHVSLFWCTSPYGFCYT